MDFDTDRFVRQTGLVPRERLQSVAASIIGVGAIGRQVALHLAALGVPRLQLIDFDHVERTNITTQGYRAAEVGLAKVLSTRQAVVDLDPTIEVETVIDRYRPRMRLESVVFCCVDSIQRRAAIWRSAGSRCQFWADGRMLGEVIRILVVADENGRQHYPTTLFAHTEAQRGSCTASGTWYTASIAAGLAVHQFTRWLRDIAVEADTCFNLLAGEWSAC